MQNLDFLQVPHKLNYPPTLKGSMSTAHANAISEFLNDSYTGTYSQRKKIVHILNCISYMYMSGDSFPITWDIDHPYTTYQEVDDEDLISQVVGDIYIESEKCLDWRSVEIKVAPMDSSDSNSLESHIAAEKPERTNTIRPIASAIQPSVVSSKVSDKSDLYIQPPVVPQFDVNKPWKVGSSDQELYAIYSSLPAVPTRQSEISVTTNVGLMSDLDMIKLFPNCNIHTRAAVMYEPCTGIHLDPVVGLIIPICHFSEAQVADNIIKYPHLYRLFKNIDGELKSFYSTIEIDGELHKIADVWNTLPESKVIPYTKDFIKEYVVRRYLLERDILHIEHRYKLHGELDPFLTLFTTPDEYSRMGYSDPLMLAKTCIQSRISYKQSRNPMLRRISNE